MNLKIWKLISIVLSAMVIGVFWGPWMGLSSSMDTIAVAIVKRPSRNIAPVMTVLMAALLSMVPALLLTFDEGASKLYPTLMGFALFFATPLVTMVVEVPIVKWRHGRSRLCRGLTAASQPLAGVP